MLLRFCLLALLGGSLAKSPENVQHDADKKYLWTQKLVYKLLYPVAPQTATSPSPDEEGLLLNVTNEIRSKPPFVGLGTEFQAMYNFGMLPRGELNSLYYPRLLKETKVLYEYLCNATTFNEFIGIALWTEKFVNEGQFLDAFYSAVLTRDDTAYVQLPSPYEVYPYLFFNSEVLEKAHYPKLYGKLVEENGVKAYVIPANYSGWYMNRELDLDSRLTYFTEDIGLNAYYFYFRLNPAFWLKSSDSARGEEYLYGHKQLLNRYYLERLSNDLGFIDDFDWEREFRAGYYPTMHFHNGLAFPQRPSWSRIPHYKYKYVKDVIDMESRVSSAIASGFVVTEKGTLQSLDTPEGLNILGNIIEGNEDSVNKELYGSIDFYARKILGFNLEARKNYQIVPSALEFACTSMRDPAFYRLYKRIVDYYHKYNTLQKPYDIEEVEFPDLKIETVTTDRLITFFEPFNTTIINSLLAKNAMETEKALIKIRQSRLKNARFSVHFELSSTKKQKVAVRIFLGPKYDGQGKPLDFTESLHYFYEMDNYILNVIPGRNKVTRNSKDFFFVMRDPKPSEVFYKNILDAIKNVSKIKYDDRVYGFPERLLLPKGKKEGLPLQLFVHVSPVDKVVNYSSRVFGTYEFDHRSYGYPFNKPIENYRYNGSNMALVDAIVYHKDDYTQNIIDF